MAKKRTAQGGRSTSSTSSKRTSRQRASTSAQKKLSRSTRNEADEKKLAGRKKSQADPKRSTKKAPGAQSKSQTKSKPRKRVTKKRPEITKRPAALQRMAQRARAFFTALRDPDAWRGLSEKLPPWTDEIGALLLIVLGVVMLTALLNSSSQGALAVTISDILRQIFGDGAYLFALGVIATGTIILLPKFGIVLELGWTRIAALETAFGALLALLHLLADDPQPRALAQEGGGGGYIGWALTELVASLGHIVSLGIFSTLLIIGIAATFRVRLYHATSVITWVRTWLQRSISRLDEMDTDQVWADEEAFYADTEHASENANSSSVTERTRGGASRRKKDATDDNTTTGAPNPSTKSKATPSADGATVSRRSKSKTRKSRSGASGTTSQAGHQPETSDQAGAAKEPQRNDSPAGSANEPGTTGDPASDKDTADSADDSQVPARPLTKAEKRQIAERARKTMGAENGRSLIAPGEPGERRSVVPREYLPDARVVPAAPRARARRHANPANERYFTVEDFTENKKIGKRNDDLPDLELLNDVELNKPTEEEINTNAKIIRNTLLEFDVETEVIDVHVGPTVTQYAVSPYTEKTTEDGETVLKRVRVNEITNLSGDLALALSAKRLRIQAPVPGHSYVGIEVPNRQPSTVALRPVLESEHFYRHRKKPLVLPLGRDVSGEPFIADLATMPHLLIAGTTGSGKSIMLAAMTTAFVMNNTPDRVRLVLLDPKMVELSRFNGLPHLLGPVETELDRIIGVLRWATREMDRRYKLLEKEAARNIDMFNAALGRRRKDEWLPYIVIVIDEIGDLMMQRPDETERTLTRLAQMARAVGIHLMVATQRPSVDVITGLIKANFPARISFAVASGVDSRVILDSTGAETLMGRGDMLFLAPDASGPRRVQGCYVSDEEVADVVNYWKQWHEDKIKADELAPPPVAPWERGMTRREVLAETDPMLEDAITLVVEEGEASASMIQRRLGLGYPRAARIIDMMHELGIVGAARPGGRTRDVLVKPGTDAFKQIIDNRMKKNRP